MHQPTPPTSSGAVVSRLLQVHRTACRAIRADSSDGSWGICRAVGKPRCYTCAPTARCPRLPLLPGYAPVKVQRQEEVAFEADLCKIRDADQQQLRRHCLSRLPLSQQPSDDPSLLDLPCGASSANPSSVCPPNYTTSIVPQLKHCLRIA